MGNTSKFSWSIADQPFSTAELKLKSELEAVKSSYKENHSQLEYKMSIYSTEHISFQFNSRTTYIHIVTH